MSHFGYEKEPEVTLRGCLKTIAILVIVVATVRWVKQGFVGYVPRPQVIVQVEWKAIRERPEFADLNLPTEPLQFSNDAIVHDRFARDYIYPILEDAQRRCDQGEFYREDYFRMYRQVVTIYRNHNMPFTIGGFVGINYADWQTIQAQAERKGSRLSDETELEQIIDENREYIQSYERQYELLTSVKLKRFDHGAFWLWLLIADLKIMLITLGVFILRIIRSREITLRDEIVLAPGRFLSMLVCWPIGLLFYPDGSDTARRLKQSRLIAEYLRDKHWSYRLSTEEEAMIEQMLDQGSLKTLLTQIAAKQDVRYRRSLVTVYSSMLFGCVFLSLRVGVTILPLVTEQTVIVAAATVVQLPPVDSVTSIVPVALPAILPHEGETLVFWPLLRLLPRPMNEMKPPHRDPGRIDHVPLAPLVFDWRLSILSPV